MKYTKRQMAMYEIMDLIIDVRCAIRDGHSAYAEECRRKISHLFKHRHSLKMDKYGAMHYYNS